MNLIDTALRIATAAHAGQTDRDGNPVILHALTVGLMGHTDEEKVAGFLHDVVEDSDLSFNDLLREGIPTGIVNALRLLTHEAGTDYDAYIQAKHGKALERVKKAIDDCSKVDLYQAPTDRALEVAIFACGCFWGTQHQFAKQKGVVNTLAGYTGGKEAFPSYADVRSHKTHHVEAVIVEYRPEEVSYETLCQLFFEIHDPAQTDGVGPDIGAQYRSCIFFRNEAQKATAEQVMQTLREKGYEVNTLLLPAEDFYIGEAYHQHYYEKTGGEPYCHVRTKKF